MKYFFKLPENAAVNKFIPKNKFYEKAVLRTKLQKEFVDKIQKIRWLYKLAESTIGISKTDNVVEIQIFEIELKKQVIPKNVLKVIDKSIPYPILYCFVYGESFSYGITLKSLNFLEKHYLSDWNEQIEFDFTGTDLEKVYQKIIKALIRNKSLTNRNFKEIVEIDSRIECLEKEAALLENKIKKEKQFNRKVEINKMLLETQKQLKKIKKELKDGKTKNADT